MKPLKGDTPKKKDASSKEKASSTKNRTVLDVGRERLLERAGGRPVDNLDGHAANLGDLFWERKIGDFDSAKGKTNAGYYLEFGVDPDQAGSGINDRVSGSPGKSLRNEHLSDEGQTLGDFVSQNLAEGGNWVEGYLDVSVGPSFGGISQSLRTKEWTVELPFAKASISDNSIYVGPSWSMVPVPYLGSAASVSAGVRLGVSGVGPELQGRLLNVGFSGGIRTTPTWSKAAGNLFGIFEGTAKSVLRHPSFGGH